MLYIGLAVYYVVSGSTTKGDVVKRSDCMHQTHALVILTISCKCNTGDSPAHRL